MSSGANYINMRGPGGQLWRVTACCARVLRNRACRFLFTFVFVGITWLRWVRSYLAWRTAWILFPRSDHFGRRFWFKWESRVHVLMDNSIRAARNFSSPLTLAHRSRALIKMRVSSHTCPHADGHRAVLPISASNTQLAVVVIPPTPEVTAVR